MSRRTIAAGLVAALLILVLALTALAVRQGRQALAAESGLRQRLAAVLAAPADQIRPCKQVAPANALVLLALGQSNAANHAVADPSAARIPMVSAEGCLWAGDPLPGGTGRGGSIWSRLPAALAAQAELQPVVISVLAVDASSLAEWTQAGSPLRARLELHLARMAQWGLPPALVLWHQGEAEALQNTSAERYRAGLQALAGIVQGQVGQVGPVRLLLAHSTICRSARNEAVHQAIAQQVASAAPFGTGPDLDGALAPHERLDGCHLNAEGLAHAAALWASAIRIDRAFVTPPLTRPS